MSELPICTPCPPLITKTNNRIDMYTISRNRYDTSAILHVPYPSQPARNK